MRYSFDVAAAEGESPYFGVMGSRIRWCGGLGRGDGVTRRSGSFWQTFLITPPEASWSWTTQFRKRDCG